MLMCNEHCPWFIAMLFVIHRRAGGNIDDDKSYDKIIQPILDKKTITT